MSCKTDLFLSFILKYKGRLTAALNCCPSFRFFLSLHSGVENYFQVCLSGSTDVCNVFHLLVIISFHILNGFALKKCYQADVSVCFWLRCGGFKRLFLFFVSVLKKNPFGFVKPTVPHSLNAQTYLNGKQCLLACSLIL